MVLRRMPDVLPAPSIAGRILRFNSYIATLFQYNAQFVDLDASMNRLYRLSEPRASLILEVSRLPLGGRSPHALARQAQVGVLRRSAVWHEVCCQDKGGEHVGRSQP